MEEIPYRNTKLIIQTIPKGTLLFRTSNTPENDIRGVPMEDETRCIIPNFNVYFYPNPFAAKRSLDKYEPTTKLYTYVLQKDVRVVLLITPSKYSRASRKTKRNFIKSCNKVPKGCMPNALSAWDPCFSDTIVKNYPDVVGMIAIAYADSVRLKRSLKKTSKNISKFFKMTTDSRGIKGLPELILHPLVKRPSKEIIVHNSDTLENNYKLLNKFNLNDESKMEQFMNKHAMYNPGTLFYGYTE
jgi:hypothetical protein